MFSLRQLVRMGAQLQQRGFATEKQILMRINATKNIQKITQSMKMVSASKLRGDHLRLETAKPFNQWTASVNGADTNLDEWQPPEDLPQKNLIIPITSHRGLCGGINSGIARGVRAISEKINVAGKDVKFVVIGEKGRAQLRKRFRNDIHLAITEMIFPATFDMASAIVSEILKYEADAVHIVFNHFKSAIAYVPMIKTIKPFVVGVEHESFVDYEIEPDNKPETLQNFYELILSSQVYHAIMENATAEQSSRMNAMETATQNANEMIESLTLQYNRVRQARITTELIEIISGASALE